MPRSEKHEENYNGGNRVGYLGQHNSHGSDIDQSGHRQSASKQMKYLVLLLLVFVPAEAARKDETLKCIRWGWIGDVFEQKVYCIEWAKKDCSNRLHKEICKRE